ARRRAAAPVPVQRGQKPIRARIAADEPALGPPCMILVIHAHPYPRHSRAVHALLGAVASLPVVEVRSLYDLYPDFDIDVAAQSEPRGRSQLVVWLHPLHWYSVPGLLKQWFDKVLERG